MGYLNLVEAQWPHKTGRNVHTLFLVTIYVEAILSLLLLFVWAQNMALRAVCWWGFAYLIQLASIWLFGRYGAVPDLVSIDLANALLFTAFAAGEESSAVLTETSREKEVEVAERIRESFAQMAQDVDGIQSARRSASGWFIARSGRLIFPVC